MKITRKNSINYTSKGLTDSLVNRLTRKLFLTIGLLVIALAISLITGSFVLGNQKNIAEQKASIQRNIDELFQNLLDQQSGLASYIATNDVTFSEPYNNGRTQYPILLQNLRNSTRGDDFVATAMALSNLETAVNDWSNNYAAVQIRRMLTNDPAQFQQARSDLSGKARFDRIRVAETQLNDAATHDLAGIQSRADFINWSILISIIVLAIVALLAIWRTFDSFGYDLKLQLGHLMDVTDRLEEGDLRARVSNPGNDELGRLGQNFNSMAQALERQQNALKERDIMESVLQLNNTLTSSLDLDPLIEEFVERLLRLLRLEMAALYLYNPGTRMLNPAARLGFSRGSADNSFALGEGLVGRVALEREPLLVTRPETEEAGDFELKTIEGLVIPATLYFLPLLRGEELLGVLVIASLYPLGENARNVLNVVASNLSSAISNAQAYRHIQAQAEELERRHRELERSNRELSSQRDELAVLNSALEEANRLRSRFLSTMSHELRTPLTAIIGFSQLSLRGDGGAKISVRQKNNLERILKNAQHLLSLVNNVLDIAKIEAGRMDVTYSEIKLKDFLSGLIDENQSLATQKGLYLKLEVKEGVDVIETDPEKLRQIILNLVSNGLKFTEKGGVTIRVSPLMAEQGRHEAERQRVCISVKDTGIGIEPEIKDRIFDEFYQADSSSTRKYGGTGLGLSIVHKLADLLGGSMEVESQPGQGSNFIITLPVRTRPTHLSYEELLAHREDAEARLPLAPVTAGNGHSKRVAAAYSGTGEKGPILPANLPEPARVAGSDGQQSRRVVLAVDDDADILTLIHSDLENTDYQVVGLNDSTRVLEMAERLHPYAITLDVLMPKANGWQILQQLKSNPATRSIPVIMLTVVSDRSAGYVLGANDYLVKPVEREMLLKTLDRLSQGEKENSVGRSQPDKSVQTGPLAPSQRRYVLVVDDERDIRELLEQTISEGGYPVKTAAGGAEALELIQESVPGIILLDLMMPGLDGFEVMHRLKTNPDTAGVPVIILTAKSLNENDFRRLKSGAAVILQKGGIPMPNLLERVKNLLDNFKV